MGAAVTALSWELFARCRWLLVLSVSLLVLLCLIGQLWPEPWRSELLAFWLVLGAALPVASVVGSMAHAEGTRLEDSGSLFPARLYTLPVPTVVLVGPPLILGTLTLLGCWFTVAVCIFRPWGADAPLFWPGLVAAAVLASLQALVWWPFSLPWMRAILLTIGLPSLIAGSLVLAGKGAPDSVIIAACLSVLLAGYAGALIGVSRGRRGSMAWRVAPEVSPAVAAYQQRQLPFSSPLEAQKWLERRRLRCGFFIFMVIALFSTLGFMWGTDILVRDLNLETLGDDMRPLRQALTLFGRSWLVFAQLPVLPLLISAAAGGSALGRLSTSVESTTCSPFLATRPLSTTEIMEAKLLTCARGVIILWAVMFLAGILWAVCMGRVGELADHLLAQTGSVPAALLVLLAGVIIQPAISWLWLVSGMGGKILRWSVLEMVPAFFGIGVLLLPGLLIAEKLERWRPVLGGFVVAALVGKAVAVCWVVSQLRREKLVSDQTIAWAVTGWVVLVVAVLGIGAWLFAVGPLLAGVAVLMLPLARPLATPLALARHRTQ
jgi:hypothetical protein